MSWRSQLENKYTLVCLGCNTETIESSKKPGQKYPKRCANCGRSNLDNRKLAKGLTNNTIRITLTREQALALGILFCECGHPPNNHFLDQKPQSCAHCKCRQYKEHISLP